MLSKLSQRTQPLKGANGPTLPAKSQQPHMSTSVRAGPTTIASSLSAPSPPLSVGSITTFDPSNGHLPGPTTAAQATRTKRGRPLMAFSPNGNGDSPKGGPLDHDIIRLVEQCENVDGALLLLRSELLLWVRRSYNGKTYTSDCDAQVKQLVRVIEQLKKAGRCVVGGKKDKVEKAAVEQILSSLVIARDAENFMKF
ncbi:hypothetical protein GJ744_005258 [Endocarpon pusillum]|uniref:Uncharacterized protein n=1 Tax=Endocarpon pusillum TaxID=364733 RepID=A0A8H7A7A9_9EURO|nr:hypothetical protein GJ744_005258 [Endocarpon pusillum]